jgi:hypothetical protein
VVGAIWVPIGAIVMLMSGCGCLQKCLSQLVRYVALDAKIPRGAPSGVTSPLSSGGALTHTHTYSQVPAHTHTVPAASVTTGNEGSHTHEIPFSTLATGTGLASSTSASASSSTNTGNGGSTHLYVSTGYHGRAVAQHLEPAALSISLQVIFCQRIRLRLRYLVKEKMANKQELVPRLLKATGRKLEDAVAAIRRIVPTAPSEPHLSTGRLTIVFEFRHGLAINPQATTSLEGLAAVGRAGLSSRTARAAKRLAAAAPEQRNKHDDWRCATVQRGHP